MDPNQQRPSGEVIAAAYRVEAELGRGRTARVVRVLHEPTGQRYALKQWMPVEECGATWRAMFEHEYHMLAQLAHPHIVRAFEYAVDLEQPFYTMELLEGADAREVSASGALDVRERCVLLRDCASALALVHARRLLHRGVSPDSLWCTPQGRGKLIGFGALVATGPQTRVAGAPQYAPPEALEGQALDARCDLYALGALAYFLLTGKDAYPVRNARELPACWRSPPQRPDELHPEIPRRLADLVMSLLSVDPCARPRSAAEVYDRLGTIAPLRTDDERVSAQAYLTSPQWVGREAVIAKLRKRVQWTVQGRGGTVPVIGADGSGKSRTLAMAVLEARRGGALAVHADAGGPASGPLGLAGTLVERLCEAMPLCAAFALDHAPVLGHISPAVHAALGEPALAPLRAGEHTRKLGTAIVTLLQRTCAKQPLLVAVDDVHRADSASLGVLGRLSLLSDKAPLLLVVASCDAPSGAVMPPPALQQLLKSRHRLELTPLTWPHARALLKSVFGAGLGVGDAASWLHVLFEGNPQACMDYAQYLVDAGVARREAGRWQVPANLREQGLPDTLEAVFERRIAALTQDARDLALGLALTRDAGHAVWQGQTHIRVEHFPLLLASAETGRAHAAIAALVRAGIVQQRDQHYVIAQRAISDALLQGSDAAERRQMHVRIAAVLDQAIYPSRWLSVRHLQLAARDAEACEIVLALAQRRGTDVADWVEIRSSLVVECTRRALRYVQAHGACPRKTLALRRLLLMASPVYDWSVVSEVGDAQLAQIRANCGLTHWEQTDASQPDRQRVLACMKLAEQRYESLPETERGLAPFEALRELAGCALVLCGALVDSHDVARVRILAGTLAPLRAQSPALAAVADLASRAVDRLTGREIGVRTFERGVVQPSVQNLPEIPWEGARVDQAYIQAVELARRGRRQGLTLIEPVVAAVGEETFVVVHARWLTHAFQGDDAQAERWRGQVETITQDDVWRRSAYLFVEAELHALTGDLDSLSAVADALAELALKFEGFRPWLAFARGCLQRGRGDWEAARASFEAGLSLAGPGEHRAYTRLAPAYAQLLWLSGDAGGALRQADALIEHAQRFALDRFVMFESQRVRALARATLGEYAAARAALQLAEQVATELELGGLPLAKLHEAVARVGLEVGDNATWRHALAQLAPLLRNTRAPALLHAQSALRMGDLCALSSTANAGEAKPPLPSLSDQPVATENYTRLAAVNDRHVRVRQALDLLLSDCGAVAGQLLLFGDRGLFSAATVNQNAASTELLSRVEAYVDRRVESRRRAVPNGNRPSSKGLIAELWDGATGLAPVLLWNGPGSQAPLAAVALLAANDAPLRAPRPALIRVLGRCLLSTGDSTGLGVACQ